VIVSPSAGQSADVWTFRPVGAAFEIVNRGSGQCLTTDGVAGHTAYRRAELLPRLRRLTGRWGAGVAGEGTAMVSRCRMLSMAACRTTSNGIAGTEMPFSGPSWRLRTVQD
jgi:hypothetical protein